MDRNWRRIGELTRARRKELGLSQQQVKDKGGPSPALLRQLEKGDYDANMHPSLVSAYERALGWMPGSFNSIHIGGNPSERDPESVEKFHNPDDPSEPRMAAGRRVDDEGQVFVELTSIKPDRGQVTRLEVRYWPGDNDRSASFPDLMLPVHELHDAAIRATLSVDELSAIRDARARRERELSEADDTIDMASLETDTAIDLAPGESQEDAP